MTKNTGVKNRTKFIGFILEKVNIKEYMTNEKLEELYNKASNNDVLRNLLEETTKKTIQKEGWKKNKEHSYKLSDIEKVIKRLTEDAIDIDWHKKCEADNEQRCWQKLFLYSVLNGFDAMADDFWERGQEAIPAALAASKLYKCMASLKQNESDQWKKRMQENAEKYEDWAYDILTRCHDDRRFVVKMKPCDLLTRVLPNWGNVTCLNLAESAENLKFYSHPVVRDLLDEKWNSDIIACRMVPSRWRPWNYILDPVRLMLCSVFPFLIPFLVTFWSNSTSATSCLQKMWTYYNAPSTIFRHTVVSQVVFVILFSYNLLWGDFNLSPPRTSWLDTLLLVWVLSMLLEEVRQMIEWEANTFVLRFRGWWSDNWNKVDVLAQLLFVFGTCLHYGSDHIVTEKARIILAFDLFIFYVLLLKYFTFVKRIGPKVFMIFRMFIDLGFFLCILFIVLVGYGITAHIILYPQVTQPKDVFESVLYRPYFQIYGELFLEEITATPDDENNSCSFNSTDMALGALPCARHPRVGAVLLAIYLAFSNVLLLNLLIAMFTNTFNQVQKQNDIHWKFQRYALINEFIHKPTFPPPLILISLMGHVLLYILFVIIWCIWCIGDEDDLDWADFFQLFHHMRNYYDEESENDKKKVNRLVYWEERKATQCKQLREKHTEQVQLMIPPRYLDIIADITKEITKRDKHTDEPNQSVNI
ncbi:transient receptor potential cation channel subfamily M member 5-like [Amphiura filiformis]|uniref:transient receptor potential cation channel subfamily M member 5-like n=1 Tax=Amphiura filiformis TaxID=82378 RepID=UPI003B2249A1